jgi:hypothetical protein
VARGGAIVRHDRVSSESSMRSRPSRPTQGQLTARQRAAIARLGSEWAVLDSVENRIIDLIRGQHARLGAGAEIPAELVALEKQQKTICAQKIELARLVKGVESGARLIRLPPSSTKRSALAYARTFVIRQWSNLPDSEICKRLDFEFVQREGPSLGLPGSWTKEYRARTYVQAYSNKKCRPLVHKLISAARSSL